MSLPEIHLATDGDLNYALFKHDDIVSNHVRAGGYEVELQTLSSELLAGYTDGIVLDIGANLGSYVVPLAKSHPHLQFEAFEPQRIVYYQLCANTFLNRLSNVYAHNVGLSNETRITSYVLPNYAEETNIGAFSIDFDTRAKDYEVKSEGVTERMPIINLDSMQYEKVRLIKIDVEGHELQVLQGAHFTLSENNYPPIIFEAWTWKFPEKRQAVFDHLESLGYEITQIGQNNLAKYKK
ncbi:MAG: FkbM family methyltransferase [Candidatus Nanopelagicales bacterium]